MHSRGIKDASGPGGSKSSRPPKPSPREGLGSGTSIRRQGFYVVVDDKAILAPDGLIDTLLATFRAPEYAPPTLPATAAELLELSRHADVEFAQVVSLLERDSVVATQVLRKAQSAFYAGRQPVRSLHEAIVRLGLSTLRDMFMEVVFKNNVFCAPGYDEPMRHLQRHSTAVAHIARKVCERTGHAPHAQHAFLCGLLHDIGKAMCMIVLAEQATGVSVSDDNHEAHTPPAFDKVYPAVQRAHEPAGAILGHLWRLPDPIVRVISSHHTIPHGKDNAIVAAVNIADWIANDLGLLVQPPVDSLSRDAMHALGASEATVNDIKLHVREMVARIE